MQISSYRQTDYPVSTLASFLYERKPMHFSINKINWRIENDLSMKGAGWWAWTRVPYQLFIYLDRRRGQ
jgi:hypothetical protein